MLRRLKSQTQLKRDAYSPFNSSVLSLQPPPALPPFLGCLPASRHAPPDRPVSGELLWAHGPLACCGLTSWCSCHLPSRVVFCINLLAAGAKWSVQCGLIYACQGACAPLSVSIHLYVRYACCCGRQAITQTKMDVLRNGNRHPAIAHEDVLSHSIWGRMITKTPNKPKTILTFMALCQFVFLLPFLRGEAKKWLNRPQV